MIKRLLSILIIGYASFHYADLNSPSWIYAVALPIIAFSSAISLALWFVMFFHEKGIDQKIANDGGDPNLF